MPSPRKDESKKDCKSSGAIFLYEDPKTGEVFQYTRKGVYRKNGRTLIFLKQSRGDNMSDHILNRVSQSYADDKAGYPPNCKEGFVAKDGKCVPVQEDEAGYKNGKNKNGKKKNGDDENKNGDDKKKNPFEKKK